VVQGLGDEGCGGVDRWLKTEDQALRHPGRQAGYNVSTKNLNFGCGFLHSRGTSQTAVKTRLILTSV
jgi:hypothetical protein